MHAMGARTYPIRHSTVYFAAGQTAADGSQVLLGIQGREIACLYFSPSGKYLRMEVREVPCTATYEATRGMIGSWMSELDAVPGTVHVQKFSVGGGGIGIRDLPDYLREFEADPSSFGQERADSLSQCIANWNKAGKFVLVWHEEYEMDAAGDVEST